MSKNDSIPLDARSDIISWLRKSTETGVRESLQLLTRALRYNWLAALLKGTETGVRESLHLLTCALKYFWLAAQVKWTEIGAQE